MYFRSKRWGVLMLVIMLLAWTLPAAADQPPPGSAETPADTIDLSLVASGLSRPVYVTAAPGDRARLFIVEKVGRIRIVENGTLLTQPFLDIDVLVGSSGNEQGLLSMAFHPDYGENGYFFVDYTDNSGDTVVARYGVSAADPNLADPSSAQVLLTVDQPYTNHNGGQLQFGPDGYLYIGLGDGGSYGDPGDNGQNPATLLASILRIDVDTGVPYGIPPTNPYVGDPNAREEIWSIGVRNPWRYSFDRLTGDMWIGDVGQDLWEEVDVEPAGSPGGTNWGWNCYEATHPYNDPHPPPPTCPPLMDLTMPVAEYSHSDGCSITGGYVYRGSPNAGLFGDYLFADYCRSNNLRTLHFNGLNWVRTDYTLVPPAGRALNAPTSFGQDAYGDLYMTDDSGGEVFKLELRPASCVAGNYDVNGDGLVSVADIQLVAEDWMRADYVPDHDVNCSGAVDIVDVQLVAAAWEM